MSKFVRLFVLLAGLVGGGALLAPPAHAQEAPRVVASADGGYSVVGQVEAAGRTWSGAQLEALVRAYIADPMALPEDLDMEVRRVVYALALAVQS